MSLKVREKVLKVESLLGENVGQSVVQGYLELPASVEDIGRVIWLDAVPVIKDYGATEDRVVAEGHLRINLVYAAEAEDFEQRLYEVTWEDPVSFNHFVEIIGAQAGMKCSCDVSVLNVEWDLRPDRRTIDIEVLLTMLARVYQEQEYTVVESASIKPPKKLVLEDVPVHNNLEVACFPVREDINGNLAVLEDEERFETILKLKATPVVTDSRPSQGSLRLKGYCDVEAIVATANAEVKKVRWEQVLPYEISVEDQRICDDFQVLKDFTLNLTGRIQAEGKELRLYGDLIGKITLVEKQESRMVLGLSGVNGVEIDSRRELVRFDNFVNEKSQQSSAQGVIELSENYPPIREIIDVNAVAHIIDYRIDEDKIFIDGNLDLSVIYLAHTEYENRPLYCAVFRNAIPIQQVIAVGGVLPGMRAEIDLEVLECYPDLINRETIEFEVTYRINTKVFQPLEEEVVVEAIELEEQDPDPPSITYVVVQEGDTLWKLAKKYNTTEEAILIANSWLREKEDFKLSEGEKVCIPRRGIKTMGR